MRIRTHANPFNCRHRFEKQDWNKIFPDFSGRLDFEVGFGRGIFLQNYAKENSDRCIIGVDVRTMTVELLSKKLKEENIANAYVVYGNGLICLEDMFKDESIDNIFVFHPDPWIKKQHLKRRVINSKFLEVAKNKLKKDGKVYISTDVEELWLEIADLFAANEFFVKTSDVDFWQKHYKTRWNEISEEKKRGEFFVTFAKR